VLHAILCFGLLLSCSALLQLFCAVLLKEVVNGSSRGVIGVSVSAVCWFLLMVFRLLARQDSTVPHLAVVSQV
jgi:hypothetical protein